MQNANEGKRCLKLNILELCSIDIGKLVDDVKLLADEISLWR